jgi:hypothetical protein
VWFHRFSEEDIRSQRSPITNPLAQGAEEMQVMELALNQYASKMIRETYRADFLGHCDVSPEEARPPLLSPGLWLVSHE